MKNDIKCQNLVKIILKNGKFCVIIDLPNIVNKQYCLQTGLKRTKKKTTKKRRIGKNMAETKNSETVLENDLICETIVSKTSKHESDDFLEGVISVGNNSKFRVIAFLYAARFLVSLFFKSKTEYHCTLPKIEKMLAIIDMIGIKNEADVFLEKIYIRNCGVGFDCLNWPSDIINKRDVLSLATTEDDEPLASVEFSDEDELGNKKKIPDTYLYSGGLPEDYCNLLTKVFKNFANYKASTLGKQIDEFKTFLCTKTEEISDKVCIDENKVKDYFENIDDDLISTNSVYRFISTN